MAVAKNTICIWFDKDAEAAARFYEATFPDTRVTAVHRAPSDYPSGKKDDVLTVGFTVAEAKAAGCDLATAKSAGYDIMSLVAGFGLDAVVAAGCDVSSFMLVSRTRALKHQHAHTT